MNHNINNLNQFFIQEKGLGDYKKVLIGGSVMLFVLVLLIAPYIVSFLDFSPYFNILHLKLKEKHLTDISQISN